MNCNQQGSFTYVSGSIATSGDVGIGSNCCEAVPKVNGTASSLIGVLDHRIKSIFWMGGDYCSSRAGLYRAPHCSWKGPATFCGLPPVDESTGCVNHETRSAGLMICVDGGFNLRTVKIKVLPIWMGWNRQILRSMPNEHLLKCQLKLHHPGTIRSRGGGRSPCHTLPRLAKPDQTRPCPTLPYPT